MIQVQTHTNEYGIIGTLILYIGGDHRNSSNPNALDRYIYLQEDFLPDSSAGVDESREDLIQTWKPKATSMGEVEGNCSAPFYRDDSGYISSRGG